MSLPNKVIAVETLRYVLAAHFAESDTFAEEEAHLRQKMMEPGKNSAIRQDAWKHFEEHFGGWIRQVVRDELREILREREDHLRKK